MLKFLAEMQLQHYFLNGTHTGFILDWKTVHIYVHAAMDLN